MYNLFAQVKGFLLCLLLLHGNVESTPQQEDCFSLNVGPNECKAYWSGQKSPPLLLVSLDGFRADYLNRKIKTESVAPTMNRLARCGVWAASGMMPSYPTKTFPNHYSIVTGLYPESHGIVHNSFYDADVNMSFSPSSHVQADPMWWKGEPIWYTAKRQNKISATYFWPGSDQNDRLREPNHWFRFNSSVPFKNRLDQVVRWLMLPAPQRPNILILYNDEPDNTAHQWSPDSQMVDEAILKVDREIQYLLDGMKREGILGCVDMMVLADHGMASTPAGKQSLILEELIPNITTNARVYDEINPSIRPHKDTKEEQDRIASQLECKNPHMRVYNKWDMPLRYHYRHSNRIPSLLLDMDVGWRAFLKKEDKNEGGHGWDNLLQEMQALFIAQGPSFKKALQVRPFHNVDLYNLMCVMIGINPAPNNGTWGALHHFLLSPPADVATPPMASDLRLAYPPDESTYNEHLMRDKCNLLTGTNSQSLDASLRLDPAALDQSIQMHTPWGSPWSDATELNPVKTLVNKNYITGFDVVSGWPKWTSYTLQQPQKIFSPKPQWRLDVRLERNASSICNRGITLASTTVPVFPFGSSEDELAVDTNVIEISPHFEHLWIDFHTKLNQIVAVRGETNIIIGPIPDSYSPSIFFILSNCLSKKLKDCPAVDLDVQVFVFPTFVRYNRNCTGPEEFFQTNVAMLRDVVQITGLHFFPKLSYRDQVDLLSRTPFASRLLVDPGLLQKIPVPSEQSDGRPNVSSAVVYIPHVKGLFSLVLSVTLLSLQTFV